mgnify:CR=1 FL=1
MSTTTSAAGGACPWRRRRWGPLGPGPPRGRRKERIPGGFEAYLDLLAAWRPRAIAALPDRDRELILLKHWQGFSDREIAGLLGMKPGAVSRALQRAKEKLRERLREEGIEV